MFSKDDVDTDELTDSDANAVDRDVIVNCYIYTLNKILNNLIFSVYLQLVSCHNYKYERLHVTR